MLQEYIEKIIKDKLGFDNCEGAGVDLVTGGGSERSFYRVSMGDEKTLIYMHYTDEREENKFYYDIARFLGRMDIKVPRIYYNENRSIFLEDLGDTHLYNLVVNGSEDKIVSHYYNVINQLIKLHKEGRALYEKKPFRISNGFNYSLYRWESKYFLDNLIVEYYNIKIDRDMEKELESDFHSVAEILSKEENSLIHRDCQSKNIMIKNNRVHFIDFQGLRYGLPQYDLASLLEDPYVNLSSDIKDRLLDYYFERYNKDIKKGVFISIYKYCAIQRLMQALGAYAFLGLKKGKREFLQYIPNGLKRLKLLLEGESNFSGLKDLLNSIFNISRIV